MSIPKSNGDKRHLGVPTVIDRFIQQAVLQVLQPDWDEAFSDFSFGFRPKRSEWWEVAEPELQSPLQAVVRPLAAARCDGDKVLLFNNITKPIQVGLALHYLDPVITDLLGSNPYQGPIPIGHECVAEVTQALGATPVLVPRNHCARWYQKNAPRRCGGFRSWWMRAPMPRV